MDVPDQVVQWWGSPNAFFDVMTGRNSGDNSPGGKLLQSTPLYPSLGNHEFRTSGTPGDFDSVTFNEMFTLPAGASAGGWYSFNIGNTHVVNLTVAQWWSSDFEKRWAFQAIAPGSEQYQWLVNDLTANHQEFTVVQFHHSVYKTGHSADYPFGAATWPEDQIFKHLVPLFNQYDVDLVLYGHDHLYEHYYEDGLHYIQSSHSGNTYGIKYSEPHGKVPVKRFSDEGLGYFTILDTTGPGTVTTYRHDGQIVEQFSLRPIPEMPSLALVGWGLLLLGWRQRRLKRPVL